VKKFENLFTCFHSVHEHDGRRTDGQTDRQTDTAQRHIMHSVTRETDEANLLKIGTSGERSNSMRRSISSSLVRRSKFKVTEGRC